MKKITLIAILILLILIFVNPSKLAIFNLADASVSNMKEIISIDISEDAQYKSYKGLLCILNDNKLKVIEENGAEIYNQDIKKENINLDINNYIDITNKNTNKGFSLDKDGKVIFSTSILPETFLYKSVNENVFINIFKNDDKEVIKILDIDGEVNNRVEINGKITNVKSIDDYILISYMNIGDKFSNKLILIDSNGNIKKETSFDDIILEVIYSSGNVYIIFSDKIHILDKNLNKKEEINIKSVNLVKCNENSNIYIKDAENRWRYIENGKFKIIKTGGDNLGLEGIDDSYILYSNNTIYNNKLKEIISFDDDIKDVEYIEKNYIAIIFKNRIKIVKLG